MMMKSKMKAWILMLMAVMGIMCCRTNQVMAGTNKTLASNRTCSIKSFYKVDGNNTDYLTYVVPQGSYVRFEIVLNDQEAFFSGIDIRVIDATTKEEFENDTIFGVGGRWLSDCFQMKKGGKINICVSPDYYLVRDGYYHSYTIRPIVTSPKNFEKENNNTFKKANRIKVNKTYKGLVMTNDDVDYFVFKAPKTKTYKIKAWLETNDSTVDYAIYNKSKKKLKSTILLSSSGWTTLHKLKLKKGQKVYIRFDRDSYSQKFYRLKVK